PDLCLDSADWPCADHLHSPKKKKKTSLPIHTKLSMCMPMVQSRDKTWTFEQEEGQRSQNQTAFLHYAED
ncbi:unnamed protein product, partial [Staurois parvus]